MENLQEVLSIKERLCILKEKDKEFRVFGSFTHRYELFPPLSENQVETFEIENQIKLPAEYRLFLTEIGNGGAGPFYGIIKFEKAIDGYTSVQPFKWTNEAVVKLDANDFYTEGTVYNGVVEICEQGCGSSNILIINGESYGEIWTDSYGELIPEKYSFARFYNNWLNGSIEKIDNIPLIKRVKVGMPRNDLIGIFRKDFREIVNDNEKAKTSTMKLIFDNVPALFSIEKGVVSEIIDFSDCI